MNGARSPWARSLRSVVGNFQGRRRSQRPRPRIFRFSVTTTSTPVELFNVVAQFSADEFTGRGQPRPTVLSFLPPMSAPRCCHGRCHSLRCRTPGSLPGSSPRREALPPRVSVSSSDEQEQAGLDGRPQSPYYFTFGHEVPCPHQQLQPSVSAALWVLCLICSAGRLRLRLRVFVVVGRRYAPPSSSEPEGIPSNQVHRLCPCPQAPFGGVGQCPGLRAEPSGHKSTLCGPPSRRSQTSRPANTDGIADRHGRSVGTPTAP